MNCLNRNKLQYICGQLFNPLHVTSTFVSVKVNAAAGSEITADKLAVHPLKSVTVTE